MKSIIIIAITVFIHTSVHAQFPLKNQADYFQVKNFLLESKKNPEQFQTQIKIKLISKAGATEREQQDERRNIFYYNSNSYLMKSLNYSGRYQRLYPGKYPQSGGLLELAGMATGILTSIFYPSYIGSIYHNSGATIDAYNTYLQSTYRHN